MVETKEGIKARRILGIMQPEMKKYIKSTLLLSCVYLNEVHKTLHKANKCNLCFWVNNDLEQRVGNLHLILPSRKMRHGDKDFFVHSGNRKEPFHNNPVIYLN